MSLPYKISRKQLKRFLIDLSDLCWRHKVYVIFREGSEVGRLEKNEPRNFYCWNGKDVCLNPVFPEDYEEIKLDHGDWIEGRKFSGHDFKRNKW